jgi:hypothetical protein
MQKEVIDKIAAPMTAAFGLVAALRWNSAIQEIFRLVFGQQSGLWAMIFLWSRSYNNSSSCNHTDRAGCRKGNRQKAGEDAR